MLPDNADLYHQYIDNAERYLSDIEKQIYDLFVAGQFDADFIVLACQLLGTDEDMNAAEQADPIAHDRLVDIGADDNMIFTHFLIFSEEFRKAVFGNLVEEYARYRGVA